MKSHLEDWDGDFASFLNNFLGNADFLDENGEIDEQQLTYRIQQLRADAEQTQVSAAAADAEVEDEEALSEEEEAEEPAAASSDEGGEAASEETSEEPSGFDSLTSEQQELLALGAELEDAGDARSYYSNSVLENSNFTRASGGVNWEAVAAHVDYLESQEEAEESASEAPSPSPSATPSPSAAPSPSATPSPSDTPSPSSSATDNASVSTASNESSPASFDSLSSDQRELLAETGELENGSSARDYYRMVLDNSNFTTSGGTVNWTVLEGHRSYLQAQEEEEEEEAAPSPSPTRSATPSSTPSPSATPTPTPSQTATSTPSPSPSTSAPAQRATTNSTPSIPSWGDLPSSMQSLLSTGARLESGFSGSGGDYYRAVLNNPDLTTADGRVSQNALQWHVDYLERQDRASSTPSPSRTQSASPTPTPTPTQTSTPTPTATQTQSSNVQEASSGGGNAAQIAMNWAVNTANRSNTYYRLGANGPDAWDCSSFTQAAYAQAGISLGRTTYDQITQGRQVSWDERQPGDLIFWGDYHMAIYLGNGQIVDAGSPSSGVTVRSVFGSPTTVRRVT